MKKDCTRLFHRMICCISHTDTDRSITNNVSTETKLFWKWFWRTLNNLCFSCTVKRWRFRSAGWAKTWPHVGHIFLCRALEGHNENDCTGGLGVTRGDVALGVLSFSFSRKETSNFGARLSPIWVCSEVSEQQPNLCKCVFWNPTKLHQIRESKVTSNTSLYRRWNTPQYFLQRVESCTAYPSNCFPRNRASFRWIYY